MIDARHKAISIASCHCKQDPICSEQRHLGIIRNLRKSTTIQLKRSYAVGSILTLNLTPRTKLDSISERIAYGTADHTSEGAVQSGIVYSIHISSGVSNAKI